MLMTQLMQQRQQQQQRRQPGMVVWHMVGVQLLAMVLLGLLLLMGSSGSNGSDAAVLPAASLEQQ